MSRVDAKAGLAVWLLATLLGIGLVESAPPAGLAVAVGGGIVFGLMCWLGWNGKRRKQD